MKNKKVIAVICIALSFAFVQDTKVRDASNNVYNTVEIGGQVWMVENLKTSNFNNGDEIFQAKSMEEWKSAGEQGRPAWCFYNYTEEDDSLRGKLYNFFAVNDHRGIAPKGFKIPSSKDWDKLLNFVGGNDVAGYNLKSSKGWKKPYDGSSGNGVDEYGFNIIPSGRINDRGFAMAEGSITTFWTSDKNGNDGAWSRVFDSAKKSVNIQGAVNATGYSIRCLKK